MRRVLLALAMAVMLLPALVGCYATGKHCAATVQDPGLAPPTYVYPYYTTRAPRDFLLDNPPSIGP